MTIMRKRERGSGSSAAPGSSAGSESGATDAASAISATTATNATNATRSRSLLRTCAPWLALVAFLALPPFVWPQSWLLAYLAQSATMIVFVVVVIGGLGSLSGALAASLLVGCVQTLAVASNVSLGDALSIIGAAAPVEWDALTLAQVAPLIPYLLLVAMLALRPRGLFGRHDDHA